MLHSSLLLFFAIILFPCICDSQALTFLYPNRAPYNYTENSRAAGILVEQTEAILKDAKINARFEEMPSERILTEIFREGSASCSFGWFKTPQREAKARYTLPTYRDTPLVALTLASNRKMFEGKTTFREIVSDPRLTPGLIKGWSYGKIADSILKEKSVHPMEVLDRDSQALMLAYERFTYTLIREAEIPDLIRLSGKPAEFFLAVPLSDLLESNNHRYIICSKGVPAEIIDRLNASITKLFPASVN